MRMLPPSEQMAILPLWGKCFPDYWEQLALEQGKIPYEEISFAAFDGEKVIAHCGIIPYKIWCKNRICLMGGIASVATDPDYRKRGIAAGLCRMTADWAEKNGFESLPLYTGFFRVYEVAGWRRLEVPYGISVEVSRLSLPWMQANSLTSDEKNEICRIYEMSEVFDGKVLRQDSGTLHSWERIFAEPEFLFARIPGAYAIKSGGVVIETGFDNAMTLSARTEFFSALGKNGRVDCFLPPTGTNSAVLDNFPQQMSASDAMHGERPMVKDLGAGDFHVANSIFFPVTDKF